MKNLLIFCISVSVLLFGGLACKNNPLAKYTKQYHCTIEGEPEPQTSEEYFNRAKKHIEIFSEGRVTSFDDCAFAALNEAIRLDPNKANAFRVRGFGFSQNKQFEQALADYGKAIEIEPRNPSSYYLRNKIYLEKEMFEKALADISEAIRFKPDDENYYYDRIFIYRKLGKNDLSEADEQKHRELVSAKIEKKPIPAPSITSNNPISAKTVSSGVLNSKVANLVQPAYPARKVRASGAVNVQVTPDEKGNVISAAAISGHSLLRQAAE
ncbi:MAG: tetratricopeptide repeat protein [Pyrinomonadaceae bacterium]